MGKFLTTKFKAKVIDKEERKIYVYKAKCNDIGVEVSIDEANHRLSVYCWDYDLSYVYQWNCFNSDKTFKKFIGQPKDIEYFLEKLQIKPEEFNFSASKKELYSWSIHHFKRWITKVSKEKWLKEINELTDFRLENRFYNDMNRFADIEGSDYIDMEEANFNVMKYSFQQLCVINALISIMETIEKE